MIVDALLEAEERGESEDYQPPPITRESMERVEREGLCKEESLEIFMAWYTFGGMNRGLNLTELLEMPIWLRKDFRYILSQISTRRRERKALSLMAEEDKPKPKGKGRGRKNAR